MVGLIRTHLMFDSTAKEVNLFLDSEVQEAAFFLRRKERQIRISLIYFRGTRIYLY